MRVVINFRVGRDATEMRLVVNNSGPQHAEVKQVDALGDVSWRPADARNGSQLSKDAIIGRALQVIADEWQSGARIPGVCGSSVRLVVLGGESALVIDLGRIGAQ